MRTSELILILSALFSLTPAKSADDGPNLEATMKYLDDNLGLVGPVNFIAYVHDNRDGSDWTNAFSFERTRVRGVVAVGLPTP